MTAHARPKRGNVQNTGGPSKLIPGGIESDQIILLEIALEMKQADLPQIFIVNTIRAALDFEGIADLMKLWKDEEDPQEKNEIIADIQDMLDACLQIEKTEEFYVKFNDLDTIANNIRLFKDSLLSLVNNNGGLKRLAELTDIPQPSLSRFFNSNSMPQRATLLKIAKGLELDELKMESLWSNNKNIGR
jgi:DNA-binding phage protein